MERNCIIPIPLIPRGSSSVGMVANYISFVISGFFANMVLKIKPDSVFTFEVSPMTQALIGCWYAKNIMFHVIFMCRICGRTIL